jgi:hypothetical protein
MMRKRGMTFGAAVDAVRIEATEEWARRRHPGRKVEDAVALFIEEVKVHAYITPGGWLDVYVVVRERGATPDESTHGKFLRVAPNRYQRKQTSL